jgi:hypothetical protein
MISESFRRTIPAGESDIVEYSFVVTAWARSPQRYRRAETES